MVGHSISDSEWKVIEMLWKQPNSTVSDVVKNLKHTGWSYSTIKTMVNRLTDKGFVEVDKKVKNSFKYKAIVKEQDSKVLETKNFLQRVFDGSVFMLVSTLAKDSNLTEKEQEELMRMISKMEEI